MQKQKALIILFLISATALMSANAAPTMVTPTAVGATNVVTTNMVPVTPAVPATTNTDQILILSNFPGTNFLVLAAVDSLLEVQIGEIAQTNSSNSAVRQVGQTLINDDTKAYNDAKALLDSMGVPVRPFNDQENAVLERFQGLSGDSFDSVFTRYLIQTHIQDIGRNEVAGERAVNHSVRAYAASNLPVETSHLNTLLNLRESLLGNPALTQ